MAASVADGCVGATGCTIVHTAQSANWHAHAQARLLRRAVARSQPRQQQRAPPAASSSSRSAAVDSREAAGRLRRLSPVAVVVAAVLAVLAVAVAVSVINSAVRAVSWML